MDKTIEALAESLKDLLKGRLKSYLSSEADKKEFLTEPAKRFAQLTVELGKAWNNEVEQKRIREEMEVVADTIQNELHAVAIDISVEFRASVRDTLQATLDFAQKVLPKVLLAIASL